MGFKLIIYFPHSIAMEFAWRESSNLQVFGLQETLNFTWSVSLFFKVPLEVEVIEYFNSTREKMDWKVQSLSKVMIIIKFKESKGNQVLLLQELDSLPFQSYFTSYYELDSLATIFFQVQELVSLTHLITPITQHQVLIMLYLQHYPHNYFQQSLQSTQALHSSFSFSLQISSSQGVMRTDELQRNQSFLLLRHLEERPLRVESYCYDFRGFPPPYLLPRGHAEHSQGHSTDD